MKLDLWCSKILFSRNLHWPSLLLEKSLLSQSCYQSVFHCAGFVATIFFYLNFVILFSESSVWCLWPLLNLYRQSTASSLVASSFSFPYSPGKTLIPLLQPWWWWRWSSPFRKGWSWPRDCGSSPGVPQWLELWPSAWGASWRQSSAGGQRYDPRCTCWSSTILKFCFWLLFA